MTTESRYKAVKLENLKFYQKNQEVNVQILRFEDDFSFGVISCQKLKD